MKTILLSLISFFTFTLAAQNIGIDKVNPEEKLDVNGAVKIGMTISNTQGALRYDGLDFEGNVDGTPGGWRTLTGNSLWSPFPLGNIFYDPDGTIGNVAIGDTVFYHGKLYVRKLGVAGGNAIKGVFENSSNVVTSEGFLGFQIFNAPYLFNLGVFGKVNDDGLYNPESFGVAGNNTEGDSTNYGGYFISQGSAGMKNIGVYGLAQNAAQNWAGYFDGRTTVTEKLTVNTDTVDAEAQMQVDVPLSGNFPHLRIAAPSDQIGYGISFVNPVHEMWIGQNIGNWDDGRFQIVSGNSFHTFTMLQNGNIGLTNTGFFTPFARLQVPQNGNMNNGGLDLTQAAIFVGANMTNGMAFDQDQIETVGKDLHLNLNSTQDVLIAEGGGRVGIRADSLIADFHVGEGRTVLFGKDTIGDGTVGSKFMFFPGQGGAFRTGYLSYDGSVGNGTTFWDPDSVAWASVAIGNNTRATGTGSVALGIRSHAANFGAVALGHLSRTKGNSAVAAGYYTRADAFVSCAVGSGNVGGGSASSWVPTDPIFEVGNSIDTSSRSNALTVMKNARVGINHSNPQAMLDIEQPNQGPGNGVLLNLATIGHWETSVDNAADYNFYFNNVLKAYIRDTDGAYVQVSDRRLKSDIRPVSNVLDDVMKLQPATYRYKDSDDTAPRSYGLIAQDVLPLFPELVSEKNGYHGLAYGPVSVIAIRAIQEQQVIIDAQQHAIHQLQEQVAQLTEVVKQLLK